MDETMVNKQVTQTKLAWLAGIIDGEGTINMARKRVKDHKDGSPYYRYWTQVRIANTDHNIISTVYDLFCCLGSKPYVYYKKATDKWKAAETLTIQNMGKAKRILDAIVPYLIGKKRHAELLLKFIDSRLLKYNLGRGRYNPYTVEELDIISELKRLNHRGNLNDFTSESVSFNKTDKIKSELHGDM